MMSSLDMAQQTLQPDIVVVDDDSLILDIVSLHLRKTNIRHSLFDVPDEAMQYLLSCMPRVLVVDFYMPLVNGIDFLHELVSVKSIEDSHVFLCSAVKPDPRCIDRLNDLASVNLMSKEDLCDRSTLIKTVEMACDITCNPSTSEYLAGAGVALVGDKN
jgi:response regulator RpfG family c-di-GMP phosphodiesterase